MGKKENPLLAYYAQEERFAQLMNGWMLGGEPYFTAQNISEADRRLDGRSGKRRGREYRQRYRDLFKKLDNTFVRLYIGTELMEYVDYAMPLRIMDCDVLSYIHQKNAVSKGHMEQKDLKQDEYLSQFSREDRLLPVINLILYLGEKPWDGATRLHEMLALHQIPEKLKQYVEDYSIHILDVCHTPDERIQEFPPDICFMLMCIKYAKDKKAFLRLTEWSGCSDISEDTFETITEYLGESEFLEHEGRIGREGEKANMGIIRELIEDGRKEGVNLGINQGIEWTKQIFKLAGEGMSQQEIAKRLSIPEERVKQVLE